MVKKEEKTSKEERGIKEIVDALSGGIKKGETDVITTKSGKGYLFKAGTVTKEGNKYIINYGKTKVEIKKGDINPEKSIFSYKEKKDGKEIKKVYEG